MQAPSAYGLLSNLRRYTPERFDPRPGLVRVNSLALADLPVHSIRRLNDATVGNFTRVVGAGTSLYAGAAPANPAIDTGYSGNPLSMVPFRPSQSPRPWMYVADSSRMRKVRSDGLNYGVGIAPPLNPPGVTFGPPAIEILETWQTLAAGWTNGGTAGALTAETRYTSGLLALVYDTGTAGWASAVPAGVTNALQPGMLIKFDNGTINETDEITQVLPSVIPPAMAVTIGSIAYKTGSTGLATVVLNPPPTTVPSREAFGVGGSAGRTVSQPTASRVGIAPYTVLHFGGLSPEYVVVQSTAVGLDGHVSLTVSTVGTHVAGEAVTAVVSFRVFLANNFIPAATTVTAYDANSTVAAGIGTVSVVTPFNLSLLAAQSLPIQPTDLLHFSFSIDNPANLVSLAILFDVDSSVNDFAHTYFIKTFSQAAIQAAIAGDVSFQQAYSTAVSDQTVNDVPIVPGGGGGGGGRAGGGPILESVVIRTPGGPVGGPIIAQPGPRLPFRRPPSQPAPPLPGPPAPQPPGSGDQQPPTQRIRAGASVWSELSFPVSALQLIGADPSATLANVQGIRFQIQVKAGAVCKLSSLWVGGGFGPNVGKSGQPYQYSYTGRSASLGIPAGNRSPANRNGISPINQSVALTFTQHPDPQVDTLDVYRIGGTLTNWTYVGSTPNSASPTFLDVYSDDVIANAPELQTDAFQPFPTVDVPKSGTCNVVGTSVVWVSGDQFNTQWAQGTQIEINGIVYTFYQQPADATHVEIFENAGTQSGVPFFITEATILARPLPAFWGPYSQGTALYGFACGDSFQPGVLFLLNGNNFDAASDTLQIEVSDPSEPLMNGCMYNGLAYLWSSERMFSLYPSFGSGVVVSGGTLLPAEGTNLFVPIEIPNGKGLFARWALAVGPKIWFLARDGIYETGGGAPTSITVGPWGLLFPHEEQPGQSITFGSKTINPPDFTQTTKLRLSYAASFLYFDYQDSTGAPVTLVYNTVNQEWGLDTYGVPQLIHYGEEGQGISSLLSGGNDGFLYQGSGLQDNGVNVPCGIFSPQMSEQQGGFQHVREGWLGVSAPAQLVLTINVDGVDTAVALAETPTTAYARIYTELPPLKGRLLAWSLTSAQPFSLWQRDVQFQLKTWADPRYSPVNPFASLARAATGKVG